MRRLLSALVLLLPLAAQGPALTAPALLPQVRFLTVAEGRAALTEGSESAYFDGLQLAELRAKTGTPLAGLSLAQGRSAARVTYADNVQAFTPTEMAMLRGVLQRLAPKLLERLPLMARSTFSYIKVGPGVEGGLPHTRGAHTVLSDLVLVPMVGLHRQGAFQVLDQFAAYLLVHEQAHVLERASPELFLSFYTQVLGFRRLDTLPDAPWIAERRVVNPDGPDLRWAFQVGAPGRTRWIRPDLILSTLEHPRMPQDFRKIAVKLVEREGALVVALDAQGQPLVEDLDAVKDYAAAFPNPDENYHPHEIVADLLGHHVTGSSLGQGAREHPLRAQTGSWIRDHLR